MLDRKTGAGTAGGGTLYDHWSADIASAADYYPGGMMMPGRYTEHDWSRMGSQSQQKDDEVYGKGNLYAFKYRMNDARINRFFSPDPLHSKYPHNSDYAFAENDLIRSVDLEGRERLVVVHGQTQTGEKLTSVRSAEVSKGVRDFATMGVALRHPKAAISVGEVQRGGTNISSVVGRITRHVAENGNMTSKDVGSESNAYRHAVWQATISNRFGSETANDIGNAHEGIKLTESGYVDFSLPAPQDINAADEVVDFLNNQIGRQIGERMPSGSNQLDM